MKSRKADLVPAIDRARQAADNLESVVPSDLWPFRPTQSSS